MDSRLFNHGLAHDEINRIIDWAEENQIYRVRIPRKRSKHNKNFRQDRDREICQRANEGATLKDLKAEFGLSKRRFMEVLKANGIKLRKEKKGLLKELELMVKMDLPKTEMAKRLNISRQYLYKLLEELDSRVRGNDGSGPEPTKKGAER